MLKVIILEDEPEHSRKLKDYLLRYAAEHGGIPMSINCFDSPIDLLTAYRCDADLLLLDIQMPQMLGIDAAKRLREMDSRVMIVFVTTLTQYAIEGYSVGAFDYVMKPLRFDLFSAKMDRICRVLAHQCITTSIDIRTREEVRRVSADEILYVEVINHDVLVHTDKGVLRQWGSLKAIEDALKDAYFARCNTCYLVNLKYVRGISRTCVDVGGEQLTISKPKRKDFLAAIAQYKGGSR